MRLGWKSFNGIVPKVAPRNLPDGNGQVAQNCWLAETSLEPIKEPLVVEAVATGTQSIYLWRRNNTTEWLSWPIDTDVVRGPIADDQYSRIYYTDGTTLHMNLWDSVKVIVLDVSMVPPVAPTITKGKLLDTAGIQVGEYNAITGVISWYQVKGVKWNENILTVMAHRSPSICQTNWGQVYSFVVKVQTDIIAGTTVQVPPSLSGDSNSSLFGAEIPLTDEGVAIGTMTVIGEEGKPTTDGVTIGNVNTTTFYGSDETFSFKVDFNRSTTQYQYYVQTIVNGYGQESPPSPVSEQVEWGINDKLQIQCASGGTKTRLYRSATGAQSSSFFFVAEVNPGATYVDSIVDGNLAETLPIIENPPAQMTGLVSMPGGFFAAFHGQDLFFSEPWLPYSWPARYQQTIDYPIVSLAVSGNDLIVTTTGNPYYITGTHPEILSCSKLPYQQACVSKRSTCFAGQFVCYAAPDGLVTISGGVCRVVTAPFYTRDQWQTLNPQNMVGSVHDGRFIGFTDLTGIIFDFTENRSTLGTTDQMATAQYSDLENDQLYLVQDTNITDWRAGENNLFATWKSKLFQNVQDSIFTSVKVIADSYTDITFKIFNNGVLVWSVAVLDFNGFRIPKLDRSAAWEIQIETQDRIAEVLVASSMTLLRSWEGIKT